MLDAAWAVALLHLLNNLLFLWVSTRALLIARDNRRRLNALQRQAPTAVPPPQETQDATAGNIVVRAAAAWGSEVLGAIAGGTPAERAVVEAAPRVMASANGPTGSTGRAASLGSTTTGRIEASAAPVAEPPPVERQPEQARLPPPHVPYSTGLHAPIARRATWSGSHQRMGHSPLRQRVA